MKESAPDATEIDLLKLRDNTEKVRQQNRANATDLPLKLLELRESINVFRNYLEDWHVSLLDNFISTILKFCENLCETMDVEALPAVAWNTRNLLELWVWTKYCCASRDNARRFYADCMRDALGLNAAIFATGALVGINTGREAEIRTRFENFARTQLGIESMDSNYERVANAATMVGLDKWYLIYNRYLSKFAHPTSLFVLGVMPMSERWQFFQVSMTANGFYFADRCVDALAEMILAIVPTLPKE
jgi:hypothetical protein